MQDIANLCEIPCLRTLAVDLCWNRIGPIGASALAAGLKRATTLERLSL